MNTPVRFLQSRLWLMMIAFALWAAAPAASQSQPAASTPLPAQLSALHRQMRDSFWRAENTLQNQIEVSSDVAQLFAPLPADNPLRAEYSRAALAADGFIQLVDSHKTPNRMRPEVLYLGALAKFSTGDNAGALQLLERLQAEYPNYKRDQYINDRDDRNPE